MKVSIRLIQSCIAILLFNSFWSAAQEVSPNNDLLLYHETADDPYLPNTFSNKKLSPAYRYKNNTTSKTTDISILTVQVNVESGGQNILGDAGNEPNIAVNPLNPNEIVIGWRQFDNVISNFRQAGWSYTSDGGQTWTFPGVLEPGNFRSDPVLDYDADGDFYYNSLSGTFTCKVFKSTDGGAEWDEGTPAGGGDKQWMTIDRTGGEGNGNIYAFWSSIYTTCPPGFFTRSIDEGFSYEECTEVPGQPFWGSLAVENGGDLYIGGIGNYQPSGVIVVKSLNAKEAGSLISWEDPAGVDLDGQLNAFLSINPQGLLGQVSIDVDRSSGVGAGNVYVLASVTRTSIFDIGDVMFARSSDGGMTWDAPVQVNDDIEQNHVQWFGTMSVAPNGRIDAIWLDTRDAPNGSDTSALYYSYSNDQGNSWSVNEKVSGTFNPHLGYPNQEKMGDYFDMISDDTGVHLAWANTFNGEQDVYYSRIIPEAIIGVSNIDDHLFSVFPNPSDGVFNMTGIVHPVLLEIFNVLGEEIYSATLSDPTNKIDLSGEVSGIYFLKIIDQDGTASIKKLIRE